MSVMAIYHQPSSAPYEGVTNPFFSPLKLADCGSLDYAVILVSTFFVEK
jgi:hypothetical protein